MNRLADHMHSLEPMHPDAAEWIVDWLEGYGPDLDASVYSNYSGRGMYGSTVTGITAERGAATWIGYATAAYNVAVMEAEEDGPMVKPLSKHDGMGMQTIYY